MPISVLKIDSEKLLSIKLSKCGKKIVAGYDDKSIKI